MPVRLYNIYNKGYIRADTPHWIGTQTPPAAVLLGADEIPSDIVPAANSLRVTIFRVWAWNGGETVGGIEKHPRITTAQWIPGQSLLYFNWMADIRKDENRINEYQVDLQVELSYKVEKIIGPDRFK